MKTLVVSRYNEDVRWLDNIKDWEISLYNKGEPITRENKKLPNLGREAETYLNFIVNNYQNLKGFYTFLQGDPVGDGLSRNENVLYDLSAVNFDLDFQYLKHANVITCDITGLPDHPGLNISEYSNKFKINIPNTLEFSPGAQFVVKAENILRREKDFYLNLLASVNYDVKPVESYILERLWKYIFNS